MKKQTKPFNSISCPKCHADERHIEAVNDEFRCQLCGYQFDDPIDTVPIDDDKTIQLITRDMLRGDD